MPSDSEDPSTLSDSDSSSLEHLNHIHSHPRSNSSSISQSTIVRDPYLSASSSQSDSIVNQSLVPSYSSEMSAKVIMYKPPANSSLPSASVLKHLVKLSTGNYIAWRQDLEILLDSCGLGEFIHSPIPEPNVMVTYRCGGCIGPRFCC